MSDQNPANSNNQAPDFRELLIEALDRDSRNPAFQGIERDRVQLLKQSTVFNIVDAVAEEAVRRQLPGATDGAMPKVDLSVGLAKTELEGKEYLILGEFSRHSSSDGWRWEGHRVKWIGDPPLKPFVAVSTVDVRGLRFGVLTAVDDIGIVRLTLADGTVVEGSVTNNSALLHALYTDPAAWSDLGTVEIVDHSSRVISRSTMWLSPYPPPEMFQGSQSRGPQ